MVEQQIRDMRIGYSNPRLQEADMAAAPLTQFQAWFADAVGAGVDAGRGAAARSSAG